LTARLTALTGADRDLLQHRLHVRELAQVRARIRERFRDRLEGFHDGV
jgi:hypothetical protein